jgi:transcriptional regulator with XRE-family HTH domain
MLEQRPILERRAELTDFLRSRRARLSPSEVGLLGGVRRRTPGLRREEVALLANIGETWYTRLEQGLLINVSPQVLNSIARALRMSETERRHLFLLAGQTMPDHHGDSDETVSPILRRVLAAFDPNPAWVRGRRWDMLASNRAAKAVFDYDEAAEPKTKNVLWRFFMDASRRASCPWETIGPNLVAQFRSVAARYPDDIRFLSLIAELQENSQHFRRWWAQHDVCDVSEGLKRFYHAEVGEITLDHAALLVPDSPDMRVIVYTAEPGSESERKLRQLTSGL